MDQLKEVKRKMSSQTLRKTVLTNPELMFPFHQGWRRELVYRNTPAPSGRRMGDTYYYTPEGAKVRSKSEIQSALNRLNCKLSLDNFDMSRNLIGAGGRFETERAARIDRHVLSDETKTKVRHAGGKTSPSKRRQVMKSPQRPTAKNAAGGRQNRPAPTVTKAPAPNSDVRLASRPGKNEPEQKNAGAGVQKQMGWVTRGYKVITVTGPSVMEREENSVRPAKPRQLVKVQPSDPSADAQGSKTGRTAPGDGRELQNVTVTKSVMAVHILENKPAHVKQSSTADEDREVILKHGLDRRRAVVGLKRLPPNVVKAARKGKLKFRYTSLVKPRMKVMVKQAVSSSARPDLPSGSVSPPAWCGQKPPWRLVVTELSGSWCMINRPSNSWALSYLSALRHGPLFYRQPRPLPVGRIQPESPCHLFCFAKEGSARWAVLPALQCLACCCLFHQYCVGLPTQPTPDNFLCKECNDLLVPEYARILGETWAWSRADGRMPPTLVDISSDEENHPPLPAPPRRMQMPLLPPPPPPPPPLLRGNDTTALARKAEMAPPQLVRADTTPPVPPPPLSRKPPQLSRPGAVEQGRGVKVMVKGSSCAPVQCPPLSPPEVGASAARLQTSAPAPPAPDGGDGVRTVAVSLRLPSAKLPVLRVAPGVRLVSPAGDHSLSGGGSHTVKVRCGPGGVQAFSGVLQAYGDSNPSNLVAERHMDARQADVVDADVAGSDAEGHRDAEVEAEVTETEKESSDDEWLPGLESRPVRKRRPAKRRRTCAREDAEQDGDGELSSTSTASVSEEEIPRPKLKVRTTPELLAQAPVVDQHKVGPRWRWRLPPERWRDVDSKDSESAGVDASKRSRSRTGEEARPPRLRVKTTEELIAGGMETPQMKIETVEEPTSELPVQPLCKVEPTAEPESAQAPAAAEVQQRGADSPVLPRLKVRTAEELNAQVEALTQPIEQTPEEPSPESPTPPQLKITKVETLKQYTVGERQGQLRAVGGRESRKSSLLTLKSMPGSESAEGAQSDGGASTGPLGSKEQDSSRPGLRVRTREPRNARVPVLPEHKATTPPEVGLEAAPGRLKGDTTKELQLKVTKAAPTQAPNVSNRLSAVEGKLLVSAETEPSSQPPPPSLKEGSRKRLSTDGLISRLSARPQLRVRVLSDSESEFRRLPGAGGASTAGDPQLERGARLSGAEKPRVAVPMPAGRAPGWIRVSCASAGPEGGTVGSAGSKVLVVRSTSAVAGRSVTIASQPPNERLCKPPTQIVGRQCRAAMVVPVSGSSTIVSGSKKFSFIPLKSEPRAAPHPSSSAAASPKKLSFSPLKSEPRAAAHPSSSASASPKKLSFSPSKLAVPSSQPSASDAVCKPKKRSFSPSKPVTSSAVNGTACPRSPVKRLKLGAGRSLRSPPVRSARSSPDRSVRSSPQRSPLPQPLPTRTARVRKRSWR